MMWAAGAVAAMSSITFPAISAIVSRNADPDQQGEFHPFLFTDVTIKQTYFAVVFLFFRNTGF